MGAYYARALAGCLSKLALSSFVLLPGTYLPTVRKPRVISGVGASRVLVAHQARPSLIAFLPTTYP